jgi:chorismate synthase
MHRLRLHLVARRPDSGEVPIRSRLPGVLRYMTAGESHGPLLTAVIDGVPAHLRLTTDDLASALARRRLGAGRGARMAFEQDEVRLTGGVRHGATLGSPISLQITNTEWPKWTTVMSADPVDPAQLAGQARAEALTRPRPGHADLAGMQKYGFVEARPVLERASARETAARVALGEVARQFLRQGLGIEVVSHVVGIGPWRAAPARPTPADQAAIDADPVRCFDPQASAEFHDLIARAGRDGDTLGGVVEVVVWGCPPGLGSHVLPDRRLDARLAGALMGIQAIKGVEMGLGFELASLPGSAAHDPMGWDDGRIRRRSDRAGGIEGGMSTGEVIWARAAMKPIATVPRALPTVDLATRTDAPAHHQRSDVCAVPAAGVVAEAVVALVIADACLEKFGGDTVDDVAAAVRHYRARLEAAGLAGAW